MISYSHMEKRRKGIGGSDVAPILGISQYKTALDIYLEKIDESSNLSINDSQYWGHKLESIILSEYEERTGIKLFRFYGDVLRSTKYRWMIASLDAISEDSQLVVDAKYMNTYSMNQWREENTDAMPDYILCQMAHYAIITNAKRVDVAVLFSNSKFKIFSYNRNEKLEELIINKTKDFWYNNVIAKNPPPCSNCDDVRKNFNTAVNDSVKIATDTDLTTWDRIKNIKVDIDYLIKEKNKLEMDLMSSMGTNECITDKSGFVLATWKNQTASRFNQKRFKEENPDLFLSYKDKSNIRVLRINQKD